MNDQIQLNEEQLVATQFYKGCCNVVASAGSGKTTVIVSRVERLVRECGVAPEKILVVTFSRKARDELCGRLMMRIPHRAMDVDITTFHSLGNQIVRWQRGKKYHILGREQDQIKIINSILSDKFGLKKDSAYDAVRYLWRLSQ